MLWSQREVNNLVPHDLLFVLAQCYSPAAETTVTLAHLFKTFYETELRDWNEQIVLHHLLFGQPFYQLLCQNEA